MCWVLPGNLGSVGTEDKMRIFKRLRGRDRSESNIERKLVEGIVTDLLRGIADETPATARPEGKSACCSCCSLDDETLQ